MPHPLPKVLGVFACALMGACVTDQEELSAEELGTTESSLCLIPPTPPPYSTLWFLPDAGSRYETFSYGSGECSAKVVAARNTIYLGASVPGLLTEAACETTMVTGRVYRKAAGTWALVYTDTMQGFWVSDVGYCFTPSVGMYVDPNQEMRIHASARRTTCYGSLCGTTYGVPVQIQAHGEGY